MPTLTEKQAERAVALLSTPHPKHPERNYTVLEAAAKTGVSRATIHRYKNRSTSPRAAGAQP